MRALNDEDVGAADGFFVADIDLAVRKILDRHLTQFLTVRLRDTAGQCRIRSSGKQGNGALVPVAR